MEQIRVESRKNYKHGFLLKEQDLRRLVHLINEQFAKISTKKVDLKFTLQYSNGAKANTDNLESVLQQENEGSSSIVKLEIQATQGNEGTNTSICVSFRDMEKDNESELVPISIRHLIYGQSRDWVFVTSSLIEERISKIKKRGFSFKQIFNALWSPLLAIVFLLALFTSTPGVLKDYSSETITLLNEIEKKWKAQEISDPIDVILQIEKNKCANDNTLESFLGKIFISRSFLLIIGSVILIGLFLFFYSKYCPRFNFYWGGYIEKYDKKESIRKLILGLFLGTIILGVIVNLLSSFIWDNI